jgi:hypothetical protein
MDTARTKKNQKSPSRLDGRRKVFELSGVKVQDFYMLMSRAIVLLWHVRLFLDVILGFERESDDRLNECASA